MLSILSIMILSSCGDTEIFSNNENYPPLTTSSGHSFIYDLEKNECTLFSADNSNIVYPASTTKLLTALLALEVMSPDTVINPGDEVYLAPENSSSAYIRPHHSLTLEMLIEAMIIPSGNDAAYAIAAACGREISKEFSLAYEDAVAVFVSEMNVYAKQIGCTESNFTTPDGFAGSDHYSTTYDMAVISKKAFENELIMKYACIQCDNVVYKSGHTNTWINTNRQLDLNSDFYNKNVTGLKTGSLEDNYSLISVYDDGENNYIIGVFGADTDAARYEDTVTLINAALTVND